MIRTVIPTLMVALTLALAGPARAVEPSERLPDPAMEARARAISAELRCVVCQNESIDESRADLARDIRHLVRERLRAGDTDRQTIAAVVARYGDFVLLRPPVKPATYALWFGPAAILAAGAIGVFVWLRRRTAEPAPATPLTPDEQRQVDMLTRNDRG